VSTIGLISDTHGFLDPRLPALFAGVEHIIHAGDVGGRWVLVELAKLAPVTAVVGNTDAGLGLRETELTELSGRRFLVHHVLEVRRPARAIQERILAAKPAVVVFGHTHRAHCESVEGVLYVNPGYAGRPRYHLARTVAKLDCEGGQTRVEFCELR